MLVQQVQALVHDLHRLAHLFHPDEIAVIAVAVLAQGNVEVEVGIDLVGLGLAQVPGDARAPQHHAGEAPGIGLVLRDHADVHVALLEDAVRGDQVVDVVQQAREIGAPAADIDDQLRRQVLVDAAGAVVVGVQPGPGRALIEDHQLLALLEAPERRRQGAHVHGLGRHVQQMAENPADLVEQHPDDLGAIRDLDSSQLLDGQDKGVLLVHRRHIVEAVEVRGVLQVGPGFHQLFGAAVQQADVGIDPLHHLAVQFQHQAQHAMGRRMLGAEIDVELPQAGFLAVGADHVSLRSVHGRGSLTGH